MRIARHTITVPPKTRVAFHFLSDFHLGAPDLAEEALRERVRLIAEDPYAVCVLGGDHGDLIRHTDRRYSPTELAPRYRQSTDIRLATLEHAQEILSPIASKIAGFADGNHERKMDEHYGGHFGVELACNLGVESKFTDYRGYVSLTIRVGAVSLCQDIQVQHGWQAGRRKGAAANQAELDFSATDADIICRGHSHKPDGDTLRTETLSHGKVHVLLRPRTWINGGSWRTGFREFGPIDRNRLSEVERSMWAEAKGFRLEGVGSPVLLLWPDKGTGTHRDGTRGRPAGVEHTLVKGLINEQTLGL